jgi:hypothetical protein
VRLAHQAARDPADAEQARADVRPDDGADLADEDRVLAEDLAAAVGEGVRLIACLDVLHDPGVAPVRLACAQEVDHPLERPEVRTRSIGVISPSTVRIGLIFSAPPSHACAVPIRPPRRRNSSVSTANQIFAMSTALRTRAVTASMSPPARAAAAPASAERPMMPQALVVSMTSMRRCGLRARRSVAAWRADSTVPEIPPEMWTETMSRPSSTSGS